MIKKIFLPLLVLTFVSCKKDRLDIDVSHIDLNPEINRFEKLLFETPIDEVENVTITAYEHFPDFVGLYTEEIIRVGKPGTMEFSDGLKSFLVDTVIQEVADTVKLVFQDFEFFEAGIQEGLKHLKYYFPGKHLPAIFTYISGFNQSLIVGEHFIGVSLEKYLGQNCRFYQYLGVPQYKVEKMYPEKIIPDIFYAYAVTEFINLEKKDNLISNMVYEGKLIYFSEAMNPDVPDSVLMGYTGKQIEWCTENAGSMWAYWAEKKLLYSIERLDLQKFIGDSPFTSTFSDESPGRTGVWTGWQIVRSFMNNNPDVTLNQLMEMSDSQDILARSGYYPE